MKEIYLDNAATTRVSEPCARAAFDAMTLCWGNPSSRHGMGIRAEDLIKKARLAVASELGAREDEIIFTSGGTEANNHAVFGVAQAQRRRGKRIIISAVEHSSVEESAARLEEDGYEIIRIRPRPDGVVHVEDIEGELTPDTVLLSFMMVNNETGAVFPVEDISRMLRRNKSGAIFHVDAVQALGKMPVKPNSIGCDLLTVSGHKLHAPKGVGALYIKKGTHIKPIIYGGSQQDKQRPGTESVPLIAAMGEAVRLLPRDMEERQGRAAQLNKLLRGLLASPEYKALSCVTVNSPEDGAPHIISIATGCIKSETLLNFLSDRGIYVSSGSACSKGKASRVLKQLALAPHIADSTIRVSFSGDNTPEEVRALCVALETAMETLVRFRKP